MNRSDKKRRTISILSSNVLRLWVSYADLYIYHINLFIAHRITYHIDSIKYINSRFFFFTTTFIPLNIYEI